MRLKKTQKYQHQKSSPALYPTALCLKRFFCYTRPMHGITLDSHDPALNLALEETLLDSLPPGAPGLFVLWRNGPSIIVGRHQNTAQEVNNDLVRRYNLPVVRRMSGGGAVYHDTGNLNFSFIVPHTGAADFATFVRPVAEVLQGLGIEAAFSGRNDILVDGRKVSGSAQVRRGGALLHHGTLLVSLDHDMLGAVLTGAPDKYQSKGIASVRSRVANISEFLPHKTPQQVMDALMEALMARFATARAEVTPAQDEAARALAAAKYSTWDWNYGQAPPFTHTRRERFAFGAVECRVEARRGHIAACKIYGDFFAERDIAGLEARLCGLPYTHSALRAALDAIDDAELAAYFTGCDAATVRDFLCGTIPA